MKLYKKVEAYEKKWHGYFPLIWLGSVVVPAVIYDVVIGIDIIAGIILVLLGILGFFFQPKSKTAYKPTDDYIIK